VFFGTPEWAVPSLDALIASEIEVAAVVTNPDRPAGRGLELRPSPVKRRAMEAGVEVIQPERARDPDFIGRIADLAPDAAVVVAYGKILPQALLDVPPLGFVNVHFSLLPAWRGAAPVQWSVLSGDAVTGVSIIVLTLGMDEGPVLAGAEEPIGPDDTAGTVGERLAEIGARLLVRTLPAYANGEVRPVEQDHERATYAPKITPAQARIDWGKPADAVRNLVRGLNPAPGAWATLEGARLKVWMAEHEPARRPSPGVLEIDDGIVVGTATTALRLTDVQLQGRRRMPGIELARGLRIAPGVQLE
jgi:methionyl-tRNA formyltransferase